MSATTVGLVIAMSAEARAVAGCAQQTAQVVQIAESVYLRVGGVGANAAERSCAALFEAGAGALASVGCAAGLAPESRPGSLAVPAELVSERGELFQADAQWRAALLAALKDPFRPLVGKIAGVDRPIGSAEKHELHARTGAIAADMESAAVARAACRFRIPMIALRVVSDGADDDVPETLLDAIDEFGRPRYRSLLAALARRPGDAARLARLRRGFNQGCSTLSKLVATTGPGLCCP